MKGLRWVAAGGVLIAGILLVSYLQYRFDRSDVRTAVEAVRMNRSVGVECAANIVSRWKGLVEVACADDRYTVDVVKGLIQDGTHN